MSFHVRVRVLCLFLCLGPLVFLMEGFLFLLPGGLPRPRFGGWSWTEGGAGQMNWSANTETGLSKLNENYEITKTKE